MPVIYFSDSSMGLKRLLHVALPCSLILGLLFHVLILQAVFHLPIKIIAMTPKIQNAVIFVTFLKQVS